MSNIIYIDAISASVPDGIDLLPEKGKKINNNLL